LDGQLAMVTLSLRSWSIQSAWFPAFDERFASASPGIAGFLHMGEMAAGAGIEYIDLGKGNEPYKAHLSNASLELASGWVAGTSPKDQFFRSARVPEHIARLAFERLPSTESMATTAVQGLRRRRMGQVR
jgi:CelD/BcsL family acetyltransferase involved in cellulose biosynthesis